MSNSKEKQCLTVDTRDVNDHGPVKFRTQADNGLRQICYYNRNKTDISFNSFLTSREQTSQKGEIEFSIVKVIDNINKSNISYSELGDELNNFNNGNIQSKLQQLSESNIVGGTDYHIKTETEQQTNDDNIQDMDELAKSQDFFQDNNAIRKKYTTTRIKSRNFLSNTAYFGINKEDYYNKNFIFDVYLLLTKKILSLSIEN